MGRDRRRRQATTGSPPPPIWPSRASSVLVLERNHRLGGACTLERAFPDAPEYVISPCAYVVGLLDEVVIRELELERYGYGVTPGRPEPLLPAARRHRAGASSSTRTAPPPTCASRASPTATSAGSRPTRRPSTGCGWRCARGRPATPGRCPSPDRAELEKILDNDAELISILFEDSIADVLDRYIDDERLKHALFGQGVIGTFAGPRDPGTASIKLMHHQGDLLGPGVGLGLRRRRHGARLVRDRPVRTGGRRRDRRRHPGRRDRPGGGGPHRRRRVHRLERRDRQRRPEADAGDARRRRAADRVPRSAGLVGDRLAGDEDQRRAEQAADLHRRRRRRRLPGDGRDHAGNRRRAGGRRGGAAGRAAVRVRGALLPERLRPVGGARPGTT